MLHTQKFLETKTLDDLSLELAVQVTHHPTDDLVILNYDQIDSPKTHPVIRECRGLVLEKGTWKVVAKSFNRFFNWGEVIDEMNDFDFSNFVSQDKEDGSLALIYYYNNEWRANTRGSFALDKMQFQEFTWQEGMCQAMGISNLQELDSYLDRNFTYVCEFCSLWNKVVRKYDVPKMYLITAFQGCYELSWEELEIPQKVMLGVKRNEFKTIEEIQRFLREQESNDPTYEGIVIRDINNNRWKIKNVTYLSLHKMKGNGDNMFNPKHLLPFIMTGEDAELLLYFPEVEEKYNYFKQQVNKLFFDLEEIWTSNKDIFNQKEFALSIKGKTPFTGILFNMRKKENSNLKIEWNQSQDLILKILKNLY